MRPENITHEIHNGTTQIADQFNWNWDPNRTERKTTQNKTNRTNESMNVTRTNRTNERPKINQLLLNNDSRDEKAQSIVVGVVVFVVFAIVVGFIIEIIFG